MVGFVWSTDPQDNFILTSSHSWSNPRYEEIMLLPIKAIDLMMGGVFLSGTKLVYFLHKHKILAAFIGFALEYYLPKTVVCMNKKERAIHMLVPTTWQRS